MSTKHHGHDPGQTPQHQDVSFEPTDIHTKTIYIYLASLAVAVMATFFISIYIERAAMKYALDSETEMAPSRAAMGSDYRVVPPAPRLQENPQQDLRNMRKEDSDEMESYRWVDKNSGIAQIPVSEAMKIIVQRGTAGGSAAGTAAPEQKQSEAKKADPKKAAQKK
jgi:hypothetical protein